jgi:hypothetical protein
MNTTMPTLLGTAELMSGFPCTEHGEAMPTASWYRTSDSAGAESFVAITNHAVYRCNSLGRIHDFFDALYERAAVDTHADALRHIGFELGGAR